MKVAELKDILSRFQDEDEVYIYREGDRLDIGGYERTEYYGAGDSCDLMAKHDYDSFVESNQGTHR